MSQTGLTLTGIGVLLAVVSILLMGAEKNRHGTRTRKYQVYVCGAVIGVFVIAVANLIGRG